ncbi:FkbM family methyltransferase [Sphingomonas montana]|uniref:FkbM family methyltransferase n=1 Tax=Sphingomonas montana TaxID=1843236 RepID=UPI0009FA8C76|nr:FkbM family methyltransferase [Sphingomonas montana]
MNKKSLRRVVANVAPSLHRIGASRLIDNAAVGCLFLGGQGAGAGWDHENEVATAATFVNGPDPVILDIGANKGEWSASIDRRLRGATYHLFEIAPYCFDPIAERMVRLERATHHRLAVSDRNGEALFHLPRVFSGLGSLHRRVDAGIRQLDYDDVVVRTVTLDSFAETAGIGEIALAKMDIEGHELFALQGASGLLQAQRIRALTFEFGSVNVNSRTFFRDIWEYLTGYGYQIARMVPGGGTLPIRSYSERLEYFRGATNYVAFV